MHPSSAQFIRRSLTIGCVTLAGASCRDLTSPTPNANASATRATAPQLVQALAPTTVTRAKGAPVTVTFTIAGYGPNAVLHVVNGDASGANRASSAEITVNGTSLVSPSSFSNTVASFDVPFVLINPATLAVRLASTPGSAITISVDAEPGTTATVNADGGSVKLLGTQVALSIPAGAVSGDLAITATPVTPDPTQPVNADVVGGSTVEFGPDGTQFNSPVTITLAYDPARLPAGATDQVLGLGTFIGGRWVEIRGTSVDPLTHTVTGQTTHFSTYSVIAFPSFTQVTIGERHVCGLSPTQDVYCWGSNLVGQLGSASTSECLAGTVMGPCSTSPTLVDGGIHFTSISAGESRTCGVSVSGDGYCWGRGTFGGLGNGGQTNQPAPTLVAGGLQWASLSVGTSTTCGLTTAGHVYCWGSNGFNNSSGALGAPAPELCGTIQCATTPQPIGSALTFIEVSAGLSGGCALATDHRAWCWGLGQFGLNGDGTNVNRQTPVAVAGGLFFDHISYGGLAACGVVGSVGYCWGNNVPYRALGIGTGPNHFTPFPISGGLSFQRVVANAGNIIFEHHCGLTLAGEAWCWGGNDAQQLGSTVSNETCGGSSLRWACQNVPVQVAAGNTFTALAVGSELTCALGTDFQTYCFGNDTFGQIGDGTTGTSRVYTQVPRP